MKGDLTMRVFELHRDEDVSGFSGPGVVAQGCEFNDGTVALQWSGVWPTSVVFHGRGVESVLHLHGHQGRTRLVWLPREVPEVGVHDRALHLLDQLEGAMSEMTAPDPRAGIDVSVAGVAGMHLQAFRQLILGHEHHVDHEAATARLASVSLNSP